MYKTAPHCRPPALIKQKMQSQGQLTATSLSPQRRLLATGPPECYSRSSAGKRQPRDRLQGRTSGRKGNGVKNNM